MSNYDYLTWKVGEFDNHGNKITLIHSAVKDYIIYESEAGVHYDDDHNKGVNYTKKLSNISNEISIIRSLVTVETISYVNSQIALAWRECFNDNPELAKSIINTCIKELISKGRQSYILSTAISFFVVLIIGLLMIHFLKFHSFYSELDLTIKIFIWGALGGLISVLFKMKDLDLDPHSKIINLISGSSRVIISGTASIIFYLAYKSGLFFSFIDKVNEREIYLLLLISFFMGFSERFIPDFSNKVDDLLKQNEK